MVDLKKIIRRNILEMRPYTSARETFSGIQGTYLDANENPFGTLNRYPDPFQKTLKKKLAMRKQLSAANLFIGNGSDEVIDLAYRIFCNPGVDKALAFSPTYGMYAVSAAINQVQFIELPLTEEFQIDTGKLLPLLGDQKLKLIFICSPNNPTGNTMSKHAVEYILDNFKGIVIIDEAYIDFARTGSFSTYINQYNNLIVVQTFSKAWGLAGARVGIACADPEIISFFNKVKPPYNIGALNQQAVIDALEDEETIKIRLLSLLREKERLKRELGKLPLVKHIYPSEANFFLIEFNQADTVFNYLVSKHIIVRNKSKEIPGCLRVSVGSSDENDTLLNALKNLS